MFPIWFWTNIKSIWFLCFPSGLIHVNMRLGWFFKACFIPRGCCLLPTESNVLLQRYLQIIVTLLKEHLREEILDHVPKIKKLFPIGYCKSSRRLHQTAFCEIPICRSILLVLAERFSNVLHKSWQHFNGRHCKQVPCPITRC